MEGATFFFGWEVALITYLQTHLGTFGASVASVLSFFGEEYALIAIVGILYLCCDKKWGRKVGLTIVAAVVWNPLIKNIAVRRRPYFDNADIRCLRPVEADADIYDIAAQGYSFPSGHAGNAAAAYGSLAHYRKKTVLTAASFFLVFLVGISRFILGIHYPTDVMAGWLLGLVSVLLIDLLDRKLENKLLLYGILLLSGLPGFFYCTSSDFYSAYGMLAGILCSFLFEERFIHFEDTRSPIQMVFRLVGCIGLFLGVNSLFKLLAPAALQTDADTASRMFRTVRYFVSVFLSIGMFPLTFRPFDTLLTKHRSGK